MNIFSPFQTTEKFVVAREVLRSEAGHGTLYTGKFYQVDYEPTHNESDYKCTGVRLCIHVKPKIEGALPSNYKLDTTPVKVPFKPGYIFNKGSYKSRLENAVQECKKRIIDAEQFIEEDRVRKINAIKAAKVWELTEAADREKAVQEHIRRIKQCQIRIDETMKKIEPNTYTGTEQKETMRMYEQILIDDANIPKANIVAEGDKCLLIDYKLHMQK